MAREDFNVVIMHGIGTEYKKIETLLKRLKFKPIVIKDNFTGEFLLKKVRKTVWNYAHSAIIVMSPDDQTNNNRFRARQNVIFELGYCLAAFDTIPKKYFYNAVIIVKETSVENFSDIHGIEVFNYSTTLSRTDLSRLSQIICNTYKKAKKYYEEL